jgi:hypothetical protein
MKWRRRLLPRGPRWSRVRSRRHWRAGRVIYALASRGVHRTFRLHSRNGSRR